MKGVTLRQPRFARPYAAAPARPFRHMSLQNRTPTAVLTQVAAMAGPTIAVGSTLPYWLR